MMPRPARLLAVVTLIVLALSGCAKVTEFLSPPVAEAPVALPAYEPRPGEKPPLESYILADTQVTIPPVATKNMQIMADMARIFSVCDIYSSMGAQQEPPVTDGFEQAKLAGRMYALVKTIDPMREFPDQRNHGKTKIRLPDDLHDDLKALERLWFEYQTRVQTAATNHQQGLIDDDGLRFLISHAFSTVVTKGLLEADRAIAKFTYEHC